MSIFYFIVLYSYSLGEGFFVNKVQEIIKLFIQYLITFLRYCKITICKTHSFRANEVNHDMITINYGIYDTTNDCTHPSMNG